MGIEKLVRRGCARLIELAKHPSFLGVLILGGTIAAAISAERAGDQVELSRRESERATEASRPFVSIGAVTIEREGDSLLVKSVVANRGGRPIESLNVTEFLVPADFSTWWHTSDPHPDANPLFPGEERTDSVGKIPAPTQGERHGAMHVVYYATYSDAATGRSYEQAFYRTWAGGNLTDYARIVTNMNRPQADAVIEYLKSEGSWPGIAI